MKIDMNRLKNYLSDLDPNTSIVDEAIATIEAVAENKTDDELYECERPLMIAYLALRVVKAQKDEVHGRWVEPSYKRKKAGICGSTDAMAGKCRCSVCRHEEPVYEEYPKYNYCPHCGAKMDEEESGNA